MVPSHQISSNDTPAAFYTTATIAALILYLFYKRLKGRDERNLNHIPTVGPSQPLLSYISSIRFLYDAAGMLRQGYERFKPGMFKVAGFNGWIVVVCGAKHIEEIRKSPDEVLSFDEAANDLVQIPYTLGKDIADNPYHIPVLSTQLTRNLHILFPDINDEVVSALRDIAPSSHPQEWASTPALDAMTRITTRVCNRAFVGLPLCREPSYLNLCKRFAVTEVLQAGVIINSFPKSLRPLASCFLTRPSSRASRVAEFLKSMIAERKESIRESYTHKPNDLLQWLLTDSQGSQASNRDLASRILAVNVASIRTPSMIMTQVLFHLASRPEYIQPLRHEIESVVNAEGWTKPSMDKMHKLDSFIKETLRVSDTRFLSMMRKATKRFTFTDGTVIPEGTMIYAASYPTHLDPSLYPNPDEFDGFRFDKLRRNCTDIDGSGSRYQLVATSTDYLAWGYGRRACPGRFFAGMVLKLVFAHLIMTYDLRLEPPGVRPPNFVFEANCTPNASANILLKRRRS